jgi:ribosomal protein L29
MKKTSLTTKTAAELITMLALKRDELRTMRFTNVGGNQKDPHAHKKTRREIARILTALPASQKTA